MPFVFYPLVDFVAKGQSLDMILKQIQCKTIIKLSKTRKIMKKYLATMEI